MLLSKVIHERKDRRRNSIKMEMLLKSLVRCESAIVTVSTLINDVSSIKSEEERIESRDIVKDYLSVLDDLYITNNQPAFSVNYRSSARVGKNVKRHFVDTSLACSLLNLDTNKLLYDLNTFGLIFESLVYRDLCIYTDYLGGRVYHFRDNVSGDEVDEIVELNDGRYGAIEVKLAYNEKTIEEAKKSLIKFQKNVQRKPEFLCIIVGDFGTAYVDKDTGIYVVPISTLKP